MSELLPTVQAANVRHSISDFLTSTFALSDAETADALESFLGDSRIGMFKGPYVRVRLPFEAAVDGWQDTLEWQPPQHPYGHQAAAFARLTSSVAGVDRRPLPTVVTTGTGSGKTEAFLYPILDHVRRARRRGVRGVKALLLYPMNALANDQAQRLTRLITGNAALAGITAGIYTGETGPTRSIITSKGLINDRGAMREDPPDILLTNYKMLDQLLLRSDDAGIWRASATSLQYLVLDEFHTYDGAQGTDVAMLLRRLGLVLKNYWDDELPVSADDRRRPLGIITPVATSATLGDKGDPSRMRAFAQDVFGEAFDDDAVITESRLSLADWSAGAVPRLAVAGLTPAAVDDIDVPSLRKAVQALGDDPAGSDLAAVVLSHLFASPSAFGPGLARLEVLDPARLLDLTRAHPLVHRIAEEAADAVDLEALAAVTAPAAVVSAADLTTWRGLVADVVAMLGHVRSVVGREALSIDVHLWVREVTRIDRAAQERPQFRWGDDGPVITSAGHVAADEALRPSFPAIYCRHCGRSGWMVSMNPVGLGLAASDESIRRDHADSKARTLPLIHAPGEAGELVAGERASGLAWFAVRTRDLRTDAPDEDDLDALDGWYVPVLTPLGQGGPAGGSAEKKDTCPACGQEDGIRFLGSAIATLLSVSLSALFGSGTLDRREKKALVFTDSVQDAAHRAGFVQARSHALSFRAAVFAAVDQGPVGLDELPDRMLLLAGDDPFARYRLLHPELAERESFAPFWASTLAREISREVRSRVRKRIAVDVALEVGLNARVGRTLELVGAVTVGVDAGPPALLAAAARSTLVGFELQSTTDGGGPPDDAALVAWTRGVLERMRTRGAIDHEWFEKYRKEDGKRWWLTGGRLRSEGAPAFPPGRQAPAYPRIGPVLPTKVDSGLDPVTSAQSWFSLWTARVLSVSPADGGRLARLLLERLARDGVLRETTSASAATVYSLPASAIVLAPTNTADLAAGRLRLVCDVCTAPTPGSPTTVDQLEDRPCLSLRCRGTLRRDVVPDSFYRRLYASPDMRRIVAREHTGLLADDKRIEYENAFKAAEQEAPDPNVLVATPTLEMGIDIGDLSAVFLASLPRTVASYLQRMGRAGRLTGNALTLAYVTGRGDQLPRLGDPLSLINGQVRPPATYLTAEEILRRQLLAHLADGFARDTTRTPVRKASQVMTSVEAGSYLGDLVTLAESDPAGHVERFAATFASAAAGVPKAVVEGLRAWLKPREEPRTSPLAQRVAEASGRWQRTCEELAHRRAAIEALLPELVAKADSPARTDDDKKALQSATTTLKVTEAQLAHLRGEHWIAVLEAYGLFPNYTLLDDGVTLDVGVTWMNPDTVSFESSPMAFRRGAGMAIREFAPGATFYASGLEIPIDAVDLGIDGESVRPWVHCSECGYVVDITATGAPDVPSSCPRCGSNGIGDTGQMLDVLELTHVTAEVRRDEARISDRSDQRDAKRFQMTVAADIDPAHVERRWYADVVGLGCTLLRSVDIRWTNLGLPGRGGTHVISGQTTQSGLFRVCEGCGKLDTEPGRNLPHEHRPWCKYRKDVDEHTVSIALSRTLTTQGLLLRLPMSVTVGDSFAVPSIAAALLLGLQIHIGGYPDHLAVTPVVEPALPHQGGSHEALLLHDVVPGGTGYLAELAEPAHLRELLANAWDVIASCDCQDEERLACHKCLLPFALSGQVRAVSRAAAERHLRTLLNLGETDGDPRAGQWTIVNSPPPSTLTGDSVLEQRFYQLLLQRLGGEGLGMAVSEIPGPRGNTARFTGGRRCWTLAPQVDIAGCRPDFVLSCDDANVPATAIFVDGRAFHASIAHHATMADDATKREALRASGIAVLAITSIDLEVAPTTVAPPQWYSPDLVSRLISRPTMAAPPQSYALLAASALDQLVARVQEPSAAHRTAVARAVPMFLLGGGTPTPVPLDTSLGEVGAAALLGEALPNGASAGAAPAGARSRTVGVWRRGAVVACVEAADTGVAVTLVLDDRVTSIDDAHADAWRLWLQLSNALALRDWPMTITTLSLVRAGTGTAAEAPEAAAAEDLGAVSPQWRAVVTAARSGVERTLVMALAATGSVPVPEVGLEVADGIPIDLAWADRHVAVLVEVLHDDVRDLEAEGWRVFGADDVEAVVAALNASS